VPTLVTAEAGNGWALAYGGRRAVSRVRERLELCLDDLSDNEELREEDAP
jgi:hypothetical protein